MLVSAIGKTDPEWTRDRLLKVPVWALQDEEPEERRRRSRRQPGDSVEMSLELRMLLVEEVLDSIWTELSWQPVTRIRHDWGRTALGALLGKVLAAELLRRAYVPKTFGDFQSLARAYSLRN